MRPGCSVSPQAIASDPVLYAGILEDLHDPRISYRKIARRHGIAASSVSVIAAREGLQRLSPRTVAATTAREGYCRLKRLELLDRALEQVDELLVADIVTVDDLLKVTMVLVRLIKQRRREEVEPSSEPHLFDVDAAHAGLHAKLASLLPPESGSAANN